ncbi:MAG TPA: glycosyltransferase family 4 protein [Longimicrobiales bacterium]
MKIGLLISSLATPGGAERVLCTMANYWARQGADVSLITLDSADRNFYPLDAGVQRIGADLMRESTNLAEAVTHNWQRVRRLKRVIADVRPDVLISFMDVTNVLALAATRRLDMPVIVSERINPLAHPLRRPWSLLRRRFYPGAAAVVVQTQGVRAWASEFVAAHKIHVIPNPVATRPHPRSNGPGANHRRTALAMGRLAKQKGFDVLLEAFARCQSGQADYDLVIVGEGPERSHLAQRIAELRLKDRVTLAGTTRTPAELLRQADLFVLSSRYEGFPNALLEAMAYGVAVISFDCPFGPAEIIRHEVDGLLVPNQNVSALAAAMDRMFTDAQLRERCAEQAQDVARRFSIDQIMQQWNRVVEAAVSHNGQ